MLGRLRRGFMLAMSNVKVIEKQVGLFCLCSRSLLTFFFDTGCGSQRRPPQRGAVGQKSNAQPSGRRGGGCAH
jgi:hypothetical protein